MTLTRDIAALCLALDASDDSALSFLADALEEAGDWRAEGLRKMYLPPTPKWLVPCDRNLRPRPTAWTTGVGVRWAWCCVPKRQPGQRPSSFDPLSHPEYLAPSLFDRLKGGEAGSLSAARIFPTRSAAFLALAEAITLAARP